MKVSAVRREDLECLVSGMAVYRPLWRFGLQATPRQLPWMERQNTEVGILLVGAAYKVAAQCLATVNGIRQWVFLPSRAAIGGVQNIVPFEIAELRVVVLG